MAAGSVPDQAAALRALTVSLLVTVALGLVEILFWVFSRNSLFLIEGAGNLAWLVPDLVMLATVRVGTRQPDRRMNYGYRRIETVFLLFFSLAIGWFVISLLERTLAGRHETLPPEYGAATVGLAIVIALVLALLGRYLRAVGKATRNRIVLVDATVVWMDMASAGILALSGIFLVLVPSVHFFQLVLTLIVGLGLLAYSLHEALTAIRELVDAAPSLAVAEIVGRIGAEAPAVRAVSPPRIRSFGGAIAVELTVETAPSMTVGEAFSVATAIEERIRAQVENVLEVKVRVEPAGASVEYRGPRPGGE